MFTENKNKLTIKNKILLGSASFSLLAGMAIHPVTSVQAQAPDIDAKASITVDYTTGQVLQGELVDESMEIASMTKMIVEYIVFEELDAGDISWDTEISISDYAHEISQDYTLSNVPLKSDETYTLLELYEAMVIYSANGATIAIAEAISGSEPKFVDRMSETIETFGIADAHLVNSTGLNNSDLGENIYPGSDTEDENKMSARSVAKIADRIIRDYPEVLEIASIPTKTFREGTPDSISMVNWNLMLEGLMFEREGVDGLKTGTTNKAGATFTGTIEDGDRRLITVVMDAGEDLTDRFVETGKMMTYGLDRFSYENVTDQWKEVGEYKPLKVSNGKKDEVNFEPSEALEMLIESGSDLEDVTYDIEWNSDVVNEEGEVAAPIKENMELGHLVVSHEDNEFGYLKETDNRIPLVTTEAVEKANIFGRMWNQFTAFIKDIANRF